MKPQRRLGQPKKVDVSKLQTITLTPVAALETVARVILDRVPAVPVSELSRQIVIKLGFQLPCENGK